MAVAGSHIAAGRGRVFGNVIYGTINFTSCYVYVKQSVNVYKFVIRCSVGKGFLNYFYYIRLIYFLQHDGIDEYIQRGQIRREFFGSHF